MFELHRNSQKRIYIKNAVYFITFNTYKKYPYFKENIFCDLFLDELELCKNMKRFDLYAFNILYNHVHLLIKPGPKYNYSQIIKLIKENTARDINYIITNRHNAGDTSTCRLRLRENIKAYRKIFIFKYGNNQCSIPQFKWQKSFHDYLIRNDRDFQNHYLYTVYNHQKHGLPNNWQYTSLRTNNS